MAILLIPMLAFVAFSVDMGYIVNTQTELQNAADAAALAGLSQLLYQSPTPPTNAMAQQAITKAKAEAARYALKNKGAGSYLQVDSTNDVIVGYRAPGSTAAVQAWQTGQPFPNTVQVTADRDKTVPNGPVPLFFAPVIGVPTWNGSAVAVAQVMLNNNGSGKSSGSSGPPSFKAVPGAKNALLLPITISIQEWQNFINKGTAPDGIIHDDFTAVLPTSSTPAPNNVSAGGDGIPEFNSAYSQSSNGPGNFGLLSVGPPSTNKPTFASWVKDGPSASDLNYFGPNGLVAGTPNNANYISGGPGLKSSLVTNADFQSIIGQTRLIPLFDDSVHKPYGQGSNYYYNIVGFAGVTVVSSKDSGSNIQVTVQPSVVLDPNYNPGGSVFTPGQPLSNSSSYTSGTFQTTPGGLVP